MDLIEKKKKNFFFLNKIYNFFSKAFGIVGDFAVVDVASTAAATTKAAVYSVGSCAKCRTSVFDGWPFRPSTTDGPAEPFEPNGDPGVGPGHLRCIAGSCLSSDSSLPGASQHDPVRFWRSS